MELDIIPSPTGLESQCPSSDEDGSELLFADDDPNDKQPQFFKLAKPVAWDFSKTVLQAEKLRPFQTSIDEKIRGALNAVTSEAPVDDDPPSEQPPADHSPTKERRKKSIKSRPKSHSNPTGSSSKKSAEKKSDSVKTFQDLYISKPLQKAVDQLEWTTPTPIQARAIPFLLAGRDVCGSATTGSGKTGAFVIPILERLLQAGIDNVTRVLILLPTRELAAQCHSVLVSLARYTAIRAALAVGGLSVREQEAALQTRPHVIVGTPGRIIDHVRNTRGFSLTDVEVFVMDEADRLLEMGFQAEVEEIIRNAPSGRQTILFSATMTPGLQGLIKLSLQNPVQLAVDPILDVASTLIQEFVRLKPSFEENKDAVLLGLVSRSFKSKVIVFFRQKVTAHRFKILFGLSKLRAAELHGNLTQAQRMSALDSFRTGDVDFLLCTDLAARGLDIAGVDVVINYDMPGDVKEYVHRVGRTARAGRDGRACSIICSRSDAERQILRKVAKQAKGELVARVVPVSIIGKWRVWIDGLEDAVKGVLKEERAEKEMRIAEMELNKAGNLIRHEKDIAAKPARSWFLSEEQKQDEKGKARLQRGLPALKGEEASGKGKKGKKKVGEKRERESDEGREDMARQRADARKSKSKRKKNKSFKQSSDRR